MATDLREFLADNLRRLRGKRGLTQTEVAEHAGLSVQAYRNLEGGRSTPRSSTVTALSRAFDVSPKELLVPAPRIEQVRFRARKKLKARRQILVDTARWLADYRELEQLLGQSAESPIERVSVGKRRRPAMGVAEQAAAEARVAFGLESDEAVRDICTMLESGGVKVRTMTLANDDFFGLSVGDEDGGPAVVINIWEKISVERWIFTAAHELGHLVLHLDGFRIDLEEEDPVEEREADRFAAHFLMPPEHFDRVWAEHRGLHLVDRVMRVKRVFGVSYKTVLARVAQHSKDPGLWKRFASLYKQRTGRGLRYHEEPVGLSAGAAPESLISHEPKHMIDADFAETRLNNLTRAALEQGLITMARAAEILDLSTAEMRALQRSWLP